jgi:hypothetical protein
MDRRVKEDINLATYRFHELCHIFNELQETLQRVWIDGANHGAKFVRKDETFFTYTALGLTFQCRYRVIKDSDSEWLGEMQFVHLDNFNTVNQS